MRRSLALLFPLLLIALLRAAEPAPSASAPPAAESPPPVDRELADVRALLQSCGLAVTSLDRLEGNGAIAIGNLRLALSVNPRLREPQCAFFVYPPHVPGCWRVTLVMQFAEQPRDEAALARLRERAAEALAKTRYLRLSSMPSADRGDEDDGEGKKGITVFAGHVASAADPRAFASFALDLVRDADALLDLEDDVGGYLMTPVEAERRPLLLARQNLAHRLRDRLRNGLGADGASEGPAIQDPVSHATHLLDAPMLTQAENGGDPSELLADIGEAPRRVAGQEALRLFLLGQADAASPEDVARLRALAYDPATGAPRDAWALYHWGRHLIRNLPEEDGAAQIVEALDALRLSCRLGCEYALGYYLHLLDLAEEPLPGGESHWEQRARWEALWPCFNPLEPAESLAAERGYRAGDLSPIRFGVDVRGEELRQLRLAVDEMNVARRARGWKTFEVVVEVPAGEPSGGSANEEDPAAAGSSPGA